jgi:hypothetical protein
MANMQLDKQLADEQVANLASFLKALTDKNGEQCLRWQSELDRICASS